MILSNIPNCSACSVNSIYSMNTCFMEEYDLPISLPQSIYFADGRRIDYLYAASADPSEVTPGEVLA